MTKYHVVSEQRSRWWWAAWVTRGPFRYQEFFGRTRKKAVAKVVKELTEIQRQEDTLRTDTIEIGD